MPAILNQGLLSIRNALKTAFAPYIYVSDDSVAFNATQTQGNPTGGTTVFLAKASTITDIDGKTFNATITINGTTDTSIQNKKIYTIGAATSTTNTTAQSRSVRSTSPDVGLGVQSGDVYTIGIQAAIADTTP